MRKLRSFKNTFIQYGILNSNDHFELIKGNLHIEEIKNMDGVFDYLDNRIFAIGLRTSDSFIFDGNKTILLSENFKIHYLRLNFEKCCIKITDKEDLIIEIVYNQKNYGLIDRIGFSEHEADYNFGLWVFNYYQTNKDNKS